MAWETVAYENLNFRDGYQHEVYVQKHEKVKAETASGKADLFSGLERKGDNISPVKFIATDKLTKDIDPKALPGLFIIQFKGKIPIKGGKTFNVFAVQKWVGELPPWTQGEYEIQTEPEPQVQYDPETGEPIPF